MPRLWHGHPTREGPKCLGPANKASPMKVKRNSHQRPMNPYSMPMQSPGKLREKQEFCVGFHEGLVGPTKCQQTKPTNKPLSHCKVVLRFLGLSHQTICVCVFFEWGILYSSKKSIWYSSICYTCVMLTTCTNKEKWPFHISSGFISLDVTRARPVDIEWYLLSTAKESIAKSPLLQMAASVVLEQNHLTWT